MITFVVGQSECRLREGGSGHHNWGSILDENYLETAALGGEQQALAAEQDRRDSRVFRVLPRSLPHLSQRARFQEKIQLPHRREELCEKLQEDRSQGPRSPLSYAINGLILTTTCRH
jgi:hypothetical protein